jgi:hypothetical protein
LIQSKENKSIILESSSAIGYELTADLMNMFEDPVVDLILGDKFNFRLIDKYKKDLAIEIEKWHKLKRKPEDYILNLRWGIRLTRSVLCWNLTPGCEEWVAYQKEFKIECPWASDISTEVLSIINGKRLEALSNKKEIFNKIAERYGFVKHYCRLSQ